MKKSLITVLLLTLYGCGGGETGNPPTPVEPIPVEPIPVEPIPAEPKSYSLMGNFEKGPFIIGSEITIQEFDDNLVSTGKTFHTETISNVGNYNMDLSLTEKLVEVSADGYYFNEISGQLSNSKLRLSALANAYDNENININILTHLSKKRIKALVSDGKIFSVAKKQAEEEVQELFNFVSADWEINDFDRMSISEYGDNNSYLLLVSAIIQNINMSTSQLSEYIERLAQDLSDNGVVNDNGLIESINLSAEAVNLSIVRTNLTTRYDELGETVNLPDFELLLNRKPIANAGEYLVSSIGVEITLDGSRSTDIDNDSLTYNWSLIESPEGSVATLTDTDLMSSSLTPDIAGNYQVSLTVSDSELTSDADIVNISTNNRAPVADAGEDFFILVGEEIILDGSNSYDLDGDILIYLWASCTPNMYNPDCTSNNDVSGWGMVFDAGVIPPPAVIGTGYGSNSDPKLPQVSFNLSVTDSHGLSSSLDSENGDFPNNGTVTVTYIAALIDNNDGTVSDGFGNMWQQDESESFNINYMKVPVSFSEGQSYCSNLNIGQYDDWRLPDADELFRLVNMNVGSPTIDTNIFPTATSNKYATSTRESQELNGVINFDNGSWEGIFSGSSGDWTPYKTKCIR
jgi:hypothetical protein